MAITVNENKTGVLPFWERPGAFVLNYYGVQQNASVFQNSAAAFSTRIPAGSTYNGPLLRVRRSTDNTEQDISAALVADANGDRGLDTTTLLAFCGAGSGFVTTWYDQSGNGRNATQATAANQPRIVNAGVVDTYAGSARPCLRATANGQALNMQGVLGQSLTIGTCSQVWAETGTRDYSTPSYFEAVGGALAWHGALASSASAFAVGFSNARFVNGTHFSNGTPFTFAAPGSVGDKPTSCRIIILNPTLPNSGTPLSASIMNDSRPGIESRWVDAMWEFVLFSTVLSAADRQTLERNQGNFYGITVA